MITKVETIKVTDSRQRHLAALQDIFRKAVRGHATPDSAVVYHGLIPPHILFSAEEYQITTQGEWEKLWREKLKTPMPGDLPRNTTAYARLWPYEAFAKVSARKGYTDLHIHWDLCAQPPRDGSPGHFAVFLADPNRKITQTSSRRHWSKTRYWDTRYDEVGVGAAL